MSRHSAREFEELYDGRDLESKFTQATRPRLPSTPARFLTRPTPVYDQHDIDASLFNNPAQIPLARASGADTAGVVDNVEGLEVPTKLHFREGSGNARKAKHSQTLGTFGHEETDNLLSTANSPSANHVYPPSQGAGMNPRTRTWGTTGNSTPPNHIPVPASTLFSRYAVPLFLPQLDSHLESFGKPS